MIVKIRSFGVIGIEAYPIEIEVDITSGMPKFTIVGLADTVIKESKERIKSAIKNSGLHWPGDRITINLTPSGIKKEGPGFDTAIALGILASSQQMNGEKLRDYFVLGELSLDGSLKPVAGILPVSLAITHQQTKNLIIPAGNAKEAAMVQSTCVFPLKNLAQTVEFVHNPGILSPFIQEPEGLFHQQLSYPVDFSEVKGQFCAKRAIEVAVAGRHNLLMIGPPGSGKTMLAKRIPTIMPDLTLEEALEITKIHSAAGIAPIKEGIISKRPFRSPHHTISHTALAGGNAVPKPGEISLAHSGVLFLDELPEFGRECLETLRQPLEDGYINISRIQKSLTFPAAFMLVCSMNPCPCGKYGQARSSCRCSTTQVWRYRSRISGPLLDRIDIHIEVPAARYQELSSTVPAETSEQIRERIDRARASQRERFKNDGIQHNAQMTHKQVRKFCALGQEETALLKMAMTEMNLSARAYDKILKVSRTIADLTGSGEIKTEHLSEAIQYRNLDRDFF